MYIGNGAYCYANSASMFIKGTGDDVSATLLEVLSGMGLGVTLYDNGLFFLHNNTVDPDVGISKAMAQLGYSFREEYAHQADECPLNELRIRLKTSPAILGPIDMGYLTYSPNHLYAKGSDHYVLAYGMNEDYIYLHDPAGFPYVRLPLEKLKLAWMGEDLPYGRGPYQYWHSVEKAHTPNEEEIYQGSILYFQHLYEETSKIGAQIGAKTGKEAISAFSDKLAAQDVTEEALANLKYFVFQLGAKRANDYAAYFEKHHQELSLLKRKQSELLGLCHSLTTEADWMGLSNVLQEFGHIEEEFEQTLASLKVAVN